MDTLKSNSATAKTNPVVGQVEEVEPTSGRVVVDPFKRRDAIKQTPPRGRSFSFSGLIEHEKEVQKRRREESPKDKGTHLEGTDQFEMDLVIQIRETAKNLRALVGKIPNTKSEIKTQVLELDRQTEKL
nr:unnamed protein product [Callosobruchus analis]